MSPLDLLKNNITGLVISYQDVDYTIENLDFYYIKSYYKVNVQMTNIVYTEFEDRNYIRRRLYNIFKIYGISVLTIEFV